LAGLADQFWSCGDVTTEQPDRDGLLLHEVEGPTPAAGGEERAVVSDGADGLATDPAGPAPGQAQEHEPSPARRRERRSEDAAHRDIDEAHDAHLQAM
jgi:hypothetical protein